MLTSGSLLIRSPVTPASGYIASPITLVHPAYPDPISQLDCFDLSLPGSRVHLDTSANTLLSSLHVSLCRPLIHQSLSSHAQHALCTIARFVACLNPPAFGYASPSPLLTQNTCPPVFSFNLQKNETKHISSH
jgi:hypothetical protein